MPEALKVLKLSYGPVLKLAFREHRLLEFRNNASVLTITPGGSLTTSSGYSAYRWRGLQKLQCDARQISVLVMSRVAVDF